MCLAVYYCCVCVFICTNPKYESKPIKQFCQYFTESKIANQLRKWGLRTHGFENNLKKKKKKKKFTLFRSIGFHFSGQEHFQKGLKQGSWNTDRIHVLQIPYNQCV